MDVYNYFENNCYQDLYQIAVDNCLKSCDYVVAIVPETALNYILGNDYLTAKLHSLTVLEKNLFEDTDCPVCIICLGNNIENDQLIYKNDEFIIRLNELFRIKNEFLPKYNEKIIFNDRDGNIALKSVDGMTRKDIISFMRPEQLDYDLSKIKVSSRAISLINLDTDKNIDLIIKSANLIVNQYRLLCSDLLLTPFKGNNKNGRRRRRLDFSVARAILERVV